MKKGLILFIMPLFLLSGCHGKTNETAENTEYFTAQSHFTEEEGFTHKVTDGQNNYLVTFTGQNEKISVTVENNDFKMTSSEIFLPDGYSISDTSENICEIITDNTGKNIPDMIKLSFSGENGKNACKFYQIKDDSLKEIVLFTDGEKVSYITGSSFYRSEPLKFISNIIVDKGADTDSDISETVKIRTYTFDPEENTLMGKLEKISPSNTLYFGYAYWGLANNTASYFTDTNLPVTNLDEYKEIPDENGSPLFYFKVDDTRFSDADSLKAELRLLFSDELAESIFENAPQKYRDIDGELYTLMGQSSRDNSLGMLTFSSYSVSEDGENMVFSSRQEKYDENGEFTGYIDGGDFVLQKRTDEDGNDAGWLITKYRYPYS